MYYQVFIQFGYDISLANIDWREGKWVQILTYYIQNLTLLKIGRFLKLFKFTGCLRICTILEATSACTRRG